jgi:glycerol-3-phosphate acyltransferase PlsY
LLDAGLKIVLAYLLGSIIGSLLVGRLRGGVDIRTQGSGNAGGTNALRTQGVSFAVWVMLVDIGKGLLAVTILPGIAMAGTSGAPIPADWLVVACGFAVVAGHVYPVWYGFRGGKGAATLIGVLAGLLPIALASVLGVWILTVMLTGFVGLGTILATCSFPVLLWLQPGIASPPLMALGTGMAVIIALTHRSNIRRMLAGNESRASKLWLLERR